MIRTPDVDRFIAACHYPGVIAPAIVSERLYEYLQALGLAHKVRQLPANWSLATEEPLRRIIVAVWLDFMRCAGIKTSSILDPLVARNALTTRDAPVAYAADTLDALTVRAALDARDAIALDALTVRAALDARAAIAAYIADTLDALTVRAALDARDAHDALVVDTDTQALHRFAAWCLHHGWFGWSWELSWLAAIWLGTQELKCKIPWAQPLFEAYIAGAWMLFWTDTTLYWVAKPIVHIEPFNDGRRLHCADGAAIESDIENLYCWHGVLVPAFVVLQPGWITIEHIRTESNTEVRRIMLERFGFDRYLNETNSQPIATDDYGTLYRCDLPDDTEPTIVVKVTNSTIEPDGHFKSYMLRVDPALRPLPPGYWSADRKRTFLNQQQPQDLTARNAVASTCGLRGEDYQPVTET